MNKRLVTITTAALLAVGAAGLWMYQQKVSTAHAAAVTVQTATISRGNISATVSGAGNIFAPQETNLSFQLTGTPITQVNVQVGDKVKTGDVLAQVDDTELQLAVTTAQAQLTTAQANLAKLQQPPVAADLYAAQAAVTSARSALNVATSKSQHSGDTIAAAQGTLDNAKAALDQAQSAYDKVSWRSDIGMLSQSLALQQATNTYKTALANYNLALLDVNDSAVKSAAQQLAQAQDALAKLTAPAGAQDVAIAQASVDTAQANLKQAQLKLDQAKIVAPFDGTVAAVNYVVGQLSPASSSVITLANLDNLQTQINLAEVDIARVKVNDPVTLNFDALGGQNYPGKIVSISPVGTVSSGVVNYVVTVALTKANASIMPGMTATANVLVDQKSNALIVSNRAIKSQGNRKTITVLANGVQTTYLVKTGVVGDQATEIVTATTTNGQPASLTEGETVVISGTSSAAAGAGSNTRTPGGNPIGALTGGFGR
ncbi:MAG: efflux RND transporter periplasmic adaptor subunit [Rudaea sp.]